ncbi:thermonuclease family protein [Parapedobacter koreensis]|uniref:thermonuclease family protein n=1 Tax=Parapedobacter koreensis TaxID=332977 RepID=UPI0021CEB1EF|nr:thermonuclease family protein [Parapedobacter koreensis]
MGIDAPETRNTGRKKKGAFGEAAKAYVTQLTLHKRVQLELDVQESDRYQRLLAYVYLEDGTFLNAHLVANGYAILDTHPPNVKYVDLFADLQQQARQEKLGLWAE